jgi:hypothetical protein
MATVDRYDEVSHDGAPAQPRDLGWIGNTAIWFAVTLAGMLLIFIGLAVDAWRHNNSAAEETLLSFNNPGHLVAAIGIGIAAFGALAGFTVSMLKNVGSTDAALRRFVPVTAAWVLVAATGVGAITYIGASGVTVGHSHDDATVAADDHHDAGDGGDAAVAEALKDEGLLPDDEEVSASDDTRVDPETVAGALTQGSSGHPTGAHDHGKHATFTELMELDDAELASMFPEGIVDESDIPTLRDQLTVVRGIAENLDSVEAAQAAGFQQTTGDVPFMGEHWLNFNYVRDGIFDPAKPEGLLFSTIGGEKKLVGVWFLQLPGVCPAGTPNCVTCEVEPGGFTSELDLWHAHIGLCIVGVQSASEGETREGCEAKGGSFTADLRWMMHVWVTPETTENADGFFAYLNYDLYEKQAAEKDRAAAPSGTAP